MFGAFGLVPEGRSSLARGVSPWRQGISNARSPGGATDQSVAPPGLPTALHSGSRGSRPWLLTTAASRLGNGVEERSDQGFAGLAATFSADRFAAFPLGAPLLQKLPPSFGLHA